LIKVWRSIFMHFSFMI